MGGVAVAFLFFLARWPPGVAHPSPTPPSQRQTIVCVDSLTVKNDNEALGTPRCTSVQLRARRWGLSACRRPQEQRRLTPRTANLDQPSNVQFQQLVRAPWPSSAPPIQGCPPKCCLFPRVQRLCKTQTSR